MRLHSSARWEAQECRSLLGRLELRDSLHFPDTRHVMSILGTGLAAPKLENDQVVFVPNFEMPHPFRSLEDCPRHPFEDWWSQKIFGSEAGTGARRDLVLTLRDQDGGAHVDLALSNLDYVRLTTHAPRGVNLRDGKLSRTIRGSGGPNSPPLPYGPPAERAHWASMRQMALEIDVALREAGL